MNGQGQPAGITVKPTVIPMPKLPHELPPDLNGVFNDRRKSTANGRGRKAY